MNKLELKVGQKVVTRDGTEWLYIPILGYDFSRIDAGNLNTYESLDLDFYNGDLTDCDGDEENDIMSVYSCNSFLTLLSDLSKVGWNLVWEREEELEVEEISVQEAMKRLEE